ncbi:MAG: tetratricopeptide repeat protein [Bdellovibrionaceae bacterium]|nr:tetratricopeptide repeat protein [Pseudobdellovibrionaceae bacterium]
MSIDELQSLLQTAKEHFTKGHYKLAEPLLLQLESEDMASPDLYYMLATIFFDRGQLKKAIALFRKSLEVDPSFTDSSVGLSIILNDLGRYDEAKKIFESAYAIMKSKQSTGTDTNLNEKLAAKHSDLGALYALHEMYNEAAEEYAKAARLVPSHTDYKIKLGECHLKLKKAPMAIDEFSEALKDSYAVDTHLKLVEAYNETGQKEKALFELDKLQVKNGSSPEVETWRRRLDDLQF